MAAVPREWLPEGGPPLREAAPLADMAESLARSIEAKRMVRAHSLLLSILLSHLASLLISHPLTLPFPSFPLPSHTHHFHHHHLSLPFV